jgi:ribosomal protein S18 acetylase RimI-like enzyme
MNNLGPVRLITANEWQVARDARLAALRDTPEAFLPGQPLEHLWDEDRWRRSCRSGIWAVAQDGGNTVGLARLSQVGPDAYVESVWTHPQHRRRGVASRLVRELIAAERPNGAGDIFVWVIQPNDPAFNLYKKLGFEETSDEQLLAPVNRYERRMRFTGHRR